MVKPTRLVLDASKVLPAFVLKDSPLIHDILMYVLNVSIKKNIEDLEYNPSLANRHINEIVYEQMEYNLCLWEEDNSRNVRDLIPDIDQVLMIICNFICNELFLIKKPIISDGFFVEIIDSTNMPFVFSLEEF